MFINFIERVCTQSDARIGILRSSFKEKILLTKDSIKTSFV